jgi:hypothetical protein
MDEHVLVAAINFALIGESLEGDNRTVTKKPGYTLRWWTMITTSTPVIV